MRIVLIVSLFIATPVFAANPFARAIAFCKRLLESPPAQVNEALAERTVEVSASQQWDLPLRSNMMLEGHDLYWITSQVNFAVNNWGIPIPMPSIHYATRIEEMIPLSLPDDLKTWLVENKNKVQIINKSFDKDALYLRMHVNRKMDRLSVGPESEGRFVIYGEIEEFNLRLYTNGTIVAKITDSDLVSSNGAYEFPARNPNRFNQFVSFGNEQLTFPIAKIGQFMSAIDQLGLEIRDPNWSKSQQ